MTEPIRLFVAGDPEQYTGGYIYDARIARALVTLGWSIETVGLAGRFPEADQSATRALDDALGHLADNSCLIIDGLVLGGLPKIIERHVHRLTIVALVHHPLADESGIDGALAERYFQNERRALAAVDHIVVTSPFTADRLITSYDVIKTRLTIVEPGVDKPDLDASIAPPAGSPRLLCVASLIPRKGHTLLVEALAQLTDLDWQCEFIGDLDRDPGYTAEIRATIAGHGLGDRIDLAGSRSPASLAAAYRSAYLFVLPSYYEGYGMVVTEALAHGLAVVTTTGGALADTLPDDAGIAIPPGDIEALTDALRRLLIDSAMHESLSRGARRAAATLPDWTRAGQRFADVLTRVTAE